MIRRRRNNVEETEANKSIAVSELCRRKRFINELDGVFLRRKLKKHKTRILALRGFCLRLMSASYNAFGQKSEPNPNSLGKFGTGSKTVPQPNDEKSHSYEWLVVWLGNKDSNPDIQSQSLLCYRYTIPQCLLCDTHYSTEKNACQ